MMKTNRNLGKLIGILFSLTITLGLSACGSSDEQTAMAKPKKPPLGAGDPKKANAELEEAVRSRLYSDEQLKAAHLTVTGDVTRNQVTLTGTVASEDLRRKAVELARSAQAGVVVSDKIRVTPKASGT